MEALPEGEATKKIPTLVGVATATEPTESEASGEVEATEEPEASGEPDAKPEKSRLNKWITALKGGPSAPSAPGEAAGEAAKEDAALDAAPSAEEPTTETVLPEEPANVVPKPARVVSSDRAESASGVLEPPRRQQFTPMAIPTVSPKPLVPAVTEQKTEEESKEASEEEAKETPEERGEAAPAESPRPALSPAAAADRGPDKAEKPGFVPVKTLLGTGRSPLAKPPVQREPAQPGDRVAESPWSRTDTQETTLSPDSSGSQDGARPEEREAASRPLTRSASNAAGVIRFDEPLGDGSGSGVTDVEVDRPSTLDSTGELFVESVEILSEEIAIEVESDATENDEDQVETSAPMPPIASARAEEPAAAEEPAGKAAKPRRTAGGTVPPPIPASAKRAAPESGPVVPRPPTLPEARANVSVEGPLRQEPAPPAGGPQPETPPGVVSGAVSPGGIPNPRPVLPADRAMPTVQAEEPRGHRLAAAADAAVDSLLAEAEPAVGTGSGVANASPSGSPPGAAVSASPGPAMPSPPGPAMPSSPGPAMPSSPGPAAAPAPAAAPLTGAGQGMAPAMAFDHTNFQQNGEEATVLKQEWKVPHRSAKKWAERRRDSLGGQIRRKPRPLRIMLGLVIIGIGAYMVVSFLPMLGPNAPVAEVTDDSGLPQSTWRILGEFYLGAQGAAAAIAFVGFAVALRGAFFRARKRVRCRTCKAEVIADVETFQYLCENGRHRAKRRLSAHFLLLLFLAAVSAEAGILIYSMLG